MGIFIVMAAAWSSPIILPVKPPAIPLVIGWQCRACLFLEDTIEVGMFLANVAVVPFSIVVCLVALYH